MSMSPYSTNDVRVDFFLGFVLEMESRLDRQVCGCSLTNPSFSRIFGFFSSTRPLTVIEVPTICTPIQRLSLPSHVFDSFGDLTFADN